MAGAKGLLILATVLLNAVSAVGEGHFRTAMVSWQKIPSDSGRLVEFTIETSWSRDYQAFTTAWNSDGTRPRIGDVVQLQGGMKYSIQKQQAQKANNQPLPNDWETKFYTGDGKSYFLSATVTAVYAGKTNDMSDDYFVAVSKVQHEYAKNGPHVAYLGGCCRITGGPGLNEKTVRVESKVHLNPSFLKGKEVSGSPVPKSLHTITVKNTNPASIKIFVPATHASGHPQDLSLNYLTWSKSTSPQMGDDSANPHWVQIASASTGQLTVTPPAGTTGLHIVSIRITHASDANIVATAEILLNVIPASSVQPNIIYGTGPSYSDGTPPYAFLDNGSAGYVKQAYVGFPISFNIKASSPNAGDSVLFLYNTLPTQKSCSEMSKVCSDLSNVCSDQTLACSDTTPVCYETGGAVTTLLTAVNSASQCNSYCSDDPTKLTSDTCTAGKWRVRSYQERKQADCTGTGRLWQKRNEMACKSSCSDRTRLTEETCVSTPGTARTWVIREWMMRDADNCKSQCSDKSLASQAGCDAGCSDAKMGSDKANCKNSCDIDGLSQVQCQSTCLVNGQDTAVGAYSVATCKDTCVGDPGILKQANCKSTCKKYVTGQNFDNLLSWSNDNSINTQAACESKCNDPTVFNEYACVGTMADGVSKRVWTKRQWLSRRWETRTMQNRNWKVRTWNDRYWITRSYDYREATVQCSDPTKYSKATCVASCSDPTKKARETCGSSCLKTTGVGADQKTEEDKGVSNEAQCITAGAVTRQWVRRVWTERSWTLPACEGSCDDPTKTSEATCTSCSDPTVTTQAACESCSDQSYVCVANGNIDYSHSTQAACVSSCSDIKKKKDTCTSSNGVTRTWTDRAWKKRDEVTCKSSCSGDPTKKSKAACTDSCNDSTKTTSASCTGGICSDRSITILAGCTSSCSDASTNSVDTCLSTDMMTRIWTTRSWTNRVWTLRSWMNRDWKLRAWKERKWVKREIRETSASVTAASGAGGAYSSSFSWTPRIPGWHVFCFQAIRKAGAETSVPSSQSCVDMWIKDDTVPVLSLESKAVNFPNALFLRSDPAKSLTGGVPQDMAAYLGGELKFTVIATDQNPSDVVSFGATSGLPSSGLVTGASVAPSSGNPAKNVFVWTPSLKSGGSRQLICFTASDSEGDGRAVDTVKACVYVKVNRCKYMVNSGDTMSTIANKFKTNYVQIWALNNALKGTENSLKVGTDIWVGHIYNVQQLDTFKKIARLFETTENTIYAMNSDVTSSTVLQTNQELCIIPSSCQ